MRHILLYRLRSRHRQLDAELREELMRPRPNHLRVCELKRRKLAVKDDIHRLETGRFHAIHE
jgi:hypothetical protein